MQSIDDNDHKKADIRMHENDFFNEDLLCALAGVAGEDNVLMSEPHARAHHV